MGPMLERMGRGAADARGAAVLEFALVAPLFLALLFGIVGYGGYFWRGHTIQQAANDAARAAIPGLTAAERQSLALGAATGELTALGIKPARISTTVTEAGETLTVAIRYDGSGDSFLNLGFVPLPGRLLQRVAAVRLGGL